MSRRRSKRAQTYEGISYRSMLERKVAEQLHARPDVAYAYEEEKLEYVLIKNYLTDFKVTAPSQEYYLEVKGRLTQEDRRKYIAVKDAHPDLDLRFLFGADNKLTKISRIRYSDWADKQGFKWAIKQIPKEWLR